MKWRGSGGGGPGSACGRKGDEVLGLRDDAGIPLWAGRRRGRHKHARFVRL